MNKVNFKNKFIEIIKTNVDISESAFSEEFYDKIADALVKNNVIILDETLALAMHAGAKAIDGDPMLRIASSYCKFPDEPEKRKIISYEDASDALYETGSLYFRKGDD